MQFQDGGYTAVDLTSPGLSILYQSFTVCYILGAVYGRYAHAGSSPEPAVMPDKFQNGV